MWDYLLQATLCMGLLYLPYHLWFRRETFFGFNRWYLLLALILSAAIPVLPRWIEVDQPVMMILPAVQLSDLATITISGAEKIGWQWTDYTLLIYWSVAGLLLLRLGRDLLAIARMWASGTKYKLAGATLVIHPDATAPFSFFNCVFAAPGTKSDTQLFDHVIDHELQHVRGRHSVDVLLIEVLCALLWVSPFVYLYRRAVRNVHEYLADNVVSKEQRIDYAQLLISQAHSGLRLALTNQFFQSQLKSRIVMMMKEPSHRINKWKYLFAVPVLALSVVLFSFRNSESVDWNNTPGAAILDTVPQEVFKVVEEMPRFPGCEGTEMSAEDRTKCAQKAMLQYIYENIKYPEAARSAKVEGRVVAQFVVEKDGSVSGVQIIRDIGSGCGEEVERVLRSMNDMDEKWVPGRQRGKIVRVIYTIPVAFKLSEGAEKTEWLPGVQRDKTGETLDAAEEIFKVVEQMPRFPGCEEMDGTDQDKYQCGLQKMLEYIYANLKYPQEARANSIEGRSVVQFVVEPNGLISTVKTLKELGYGTDAEVIRVVESMNSMSQRWIPGRQRGKAVRVQLVLPVMFKL